VGGSLVLNQLKVTAVVNGELPVEDAGRLVQLG
jgi:hypothetical protein